VMLSLVSRRLRYLGSLTLLAVVTAFLGCESAADGGDDGFEVKIGSKSFTESVILGELVAHLIVAEGGEPTHRDQMGGTRFLWSAITSGAIDCYPEYTGTMLKEIFADEDIADEAALEQLLAERGIRMSKRLGFNNTYGLAMRPEQAEELGIESISDLRNHPDLVFGFSNEFMDRADGWRALKAKYDLPQQNVSGIDHDLSYRAIDAGQADLIVVYTTDAEIADYDLRILTDDLQHFPVYDAVILYRADTAERWPPLEQAIGRLEGAIDENAMMNMNERVKIQGEPDSDVAADFVRSQFAIDAVSRAEGPMQQLARNTWDHLILVGISLCMAIATAVPLGIVAARRPQAGQAILGIVGVLWTVPSLVLFVFMIPLLGIGGVPAVAALFLYSLLPIVRNTHAGLLNISPSVLESADALGLSRTARLRLIELPLASRSILAGTKIAAVINVGTATLGALIGAGGYGQPIITGIRLDNPTLIYGQGAIPNAVMSLVVLGLFEIAERKLVPWGLRLQPSR